MEFNLADLFEAVVEAVPGNEALVTGESGVADRRFSYADLEGRANRLAHVLIDGGISSGDHVGLHLRNGIEYVEAMLALFKIGATPVNVNYRYVVDELRYLFEDAQLKGVITEPDLVDRIDPLRTTVASLSFVLVRGADYETALAGSSPAWVERVARSADDLYLLYTGGTTGMPKGVMWRHEDIFFASLGGRGTPSRGIPALVRPEDISARAIAGDPISRRLPLCPLMHGGAMWVALQTLLNGGTLVLSTDLHFDAREALALLASERVELTMLIGDATARPLADVLAACPDDFDLSALQVIASGGAIMSPAVKATLRAALPHIKIVDTFGASETGGQGRLRAAAHATGADADGRDGHGALHLLTDADTAVFDDELRPVVPGSGQIGRLARTGNIPYGYYRDPEKTAATFPVIDGVRWSVPGDLATIAADGTITLLGRGAMCINTGGEKVFPEEVEGVIKSHPAVFDAMVIGVPDERFGQRVVAVVSGREPASLSGGSDADTGRDGWSDEDLDAHTRALVSGYKVPRSWVVVDHCERLLTGKPDYRWALATALDALDGYRSER